MEYFSFTLLSSLEFLSIIVLMFTVFNLSFKNLYWHTGFICLFLANVSHLLRNTGISDGSVSVAIQMLLYVLLVCLLYRINILWAVIVAITGYVGYIIIQLTIFYILILTNFMSPEELVPNTIKFYTLQGLSILVPLIVSHFLKTMNWHLNFIPTRKHIKLKLKNENKILLFVSIIAFIVAGLAYYFISIGQTIIFFIVTIMQFATIVTILYYSIKKEVSNVH